SDVRRSSSKHEAGSLLQTFLSWSAGLECRATENRDNSKLGGSMRRSSSALMVLASAITTAWLSSTLAFAQAKPQAGGSSAPGRSAAAQPDIEGIWGFATLTPLQRPKEMAGKEVLSADEKARLEEQAARDQFVDRPA